MPMGRGERILYVDDEEILARMAERALGMIGYNASIQTNSKVALDIFKEAPDTFDLVITDQTMPLMTGLQLAREVHAIRPELPIILVSGFTEVITPDVLQNEGITEFLAKPLVPTELAQAIRRALG
jgi:DNA-binding NtrC family response regulator